MHDNRQPALLEQVDPPLSCRENAVDLLYARHWAELCNHIKKRFGAGPPDPEDVVQQAFLKYATLENAHQIDNARAYLFRTAHNILIDEHRRLVSQAASEELAERWSAGTSDVLTPERVLTGRERLNVLTTALRAMPAVRRRSFLLNRLHGLSCAAIARMTGYSESAVKKHIAITLTDLEAVLTCAEDDEERTHK